MIPLTWWSFFLVAESNPRNTIGLKNHREFFIMIIGLALIAVVGVVVDLCLAAMMAFRQEAGLQSSVLVGLHFAYSVALLATDIPIVRIHVGLICRNELGKEWRRRSHYIANGTSKGDNVLPDDMSVDEFNDFLDRDAFEYVPERRGLGFCVRPSLTRGRLSPKVL